MSGCLLFAVPYHWLVPVLCLRPALKMIVQRTSPQPLSLTTALPFGTVSLLLPLLSCPALPSPPTPRCLLAALPAACLPASSCMRCADAHHRSGGTLQTAPLFPAP